MTSNLQQGPKITRKHNFRAVHQSLRGCMDRLFTHLSSVCGSLCGWSCGQRTNAGRLYYWSWWCLEGWSSFHWGWPGEGSVWKDLEKGTDTFIHVFSKYKSQFYDLYFVFRSSTRMWLTVYGIFFKYIHPSVVNFPQTSTRGHYRCVCVTFC